MTEQYSALSGLIIPFSRAMEACNIDSTQALKTCGIDSHTLQDQEARISSQKFNVLVDYCNQQLESNDFSIQVAKQFQPSMFHVLGYAMMSSSSLKDALGRIVKYKQVLSNSSELSLIEDGTDLIFNMTLFSRPDSDEKVLSRCVVETWLGTIVQFARELVDQTLELKKVVLCYPKPDHDTGYLNDYFQCDVEFNANTSMLVFDLQQANIPLLSGNPQVNQIHEKLLAELLSRVNKDDLTNMVITLICDVLPLGAPSQTDIANQLNMSLRNLQRKLHDNGTNYKDILDNIRKKLTLGYISQKHLSISEISYLVGFSDTSNFNRAFRRWTNQAPGKYRTDTLGID